VLSLDDGSKIRTTLGVLCDGIAEGLIVRG
jgi:hypothetical protein